MSWTQLLNLRIDEEPVAKPRPRITTRGGKPRTFTPTAYTRIEDRIAERVRAALPEGWVPLDRVAVQLSIIAGLRMPLSIPKSRRDVVQAVGRPDIDNYAKTVMDALTRAGVWHDDACVTDLHVRKMYLPPGEAPGWVICVSAAQ